MSEFWNAFSSYGVVGCDGSNSPGEVGANGVAGDVGEIFDGGVGIPGLVGDSVITTSCILGVDFLEIGALGTGAKSNLAGGPSGGLRRCSGTHPLFGLDCRTVCVLVEVG